MSIITAVTHSGHHHGDDVLATWFLQQVFGEELNVIRSDDPRVMREATILYDCGGRYDPENWRFDHHSGPRLPVPWAGRSCGYATAGLIWRHWGGKIVRDIMLNHEGSSWQGLLEACDEEQVDIWVQEFAQRMDEDIVSPVDAWDQGLRPDKRGKANFLPLQWLLSTLDFDTAVRAMGDVFMFRLRYMLNHEGDGWKLRRDLIENGETSFFATEGGILVVAGDTKRVDVNAAKIMLCEELDLPCVGVISPLRHGTKWALFLVEPLPAHVEIPAHLEHLVNRRCFYHSQQEVLLGLVFSAYPAAQDSACTLEGDPLS